MKMRLFGFMLIGFVLIGASPVPEVQVSENKLTIDVKESPLGWILKEIEGQADIRFTLMGKEEIAEALVSEGFRDLPLEEGIPRLLGRWDYAFVTDQKTGGLKEVYILSRNSKGEASSMETEKPGRENPFFEPGAFRAKDATHRFPETVPDPPPLPDMEEEHKRFFDDGTGTEKAYERARSPSAF